MDSVAVTLVCWLCAVFTSILRCFLAICFQCVGNLFRSPDSAASKSPRQQVAFQVLSLRSNAIAVKMDYYSQRWYSGHGPDLKDHSVSEPWQQDPHFRAFNKRRYWGRPPVHCPQDENVPHDFSNEYGRPLPHQLWSPCLGYRRTESNPRSSSRDCASAERRSKNSFQYPFFDDNNTDRVWSCTDDRNMLYPDSAEEVRISVNGLQL